VQEDYTTPIESGPPPIRPPEYTPFRRLPWLLGLLAGLLVVLVLPHVVQEVQFAAARGRMLGEAEVAREILGELPEPEERFPLVVKAVEPSVVGIETVQVVDGRVPRDEWAFPLRGPYQLRAQGEGSGVIMDAEGYVVTNFHVIGRADKITVKLADERTVDDVQVVGVDPATDIAVLKIGASGLTAAKWGDSDAVDVGDSVLAVGNPFRLARTVTSGIISAKSRRGIVEDLSYQDFLQTDAAVNPGNSGGPLVNMSGEVVGINTAIYGERYQGISFAIPSHIAKDVYEKIKTTGTVARGWLGVGLAVFTEKSAARLGLEEPHGALVGSVVPGSPAEKAGIQIDDVIVHWNDEPIDDATDLRMAVAGTKIGSKAKVKLLRGGRTEEVTVTVGQRPPGLKR